MCESLARTGKVLGGSGMLVSSPSSQTGIINPSRYLRVLSGDWAGIVCACRGAVPRQAGNPVMSSRGYVMDMYGYDQGWIACLGTAVQEKVYLDVASAARGDCTVFWK